MSTQPLRIFPLPSATFTDHAVYVGQVLAALILGPSPLHPEWAVRVYRADLLPRVTRDRTFIAAGSYDAAVSLLTLEPEALAA